MPKEEKLPFLISKPSPHRVGDGEDAKTLNFYAVSVGTMFALKEPAKLIGKALAVLFSSDSKDVGSMQRNWASEVAPGVMESEIMIEAIKPELASLRLNSKRDAVMDIISALADDNNLKNIGELILDSLRDDFPRGSDHRPPPITFAKELPMPVLMQMLMGVAKANKGVFGPLGEKIAAMKDQINNVVEKTIAAKLADLDSPNPSQPQNQTQNPSTGETPGSNSKINSSGQPSVTTDGSSSQTSP